MSPQGLAAHAKKMEVIINPPVTLLADEYINGEQPFHGFTLICNKCSGKNIQISTTDGYTTDAGTGFPAEITVRCRECGFTSTKD